MRRVTWTVALFTLGACVYFSAKCAAAVSRARSLGRAARLAARVRKLDEDQLLAEPALLAELTAMLELWQSDFLAARIAADALCRISRPGRVKDRLHDLGVTQTLARAISRSAEQDDRPNIARQYRRRLVRFDGAQPVAPGQMPGQLPFAPRPFALVQDVFLALASSLSDGGGQSRLSAFEDVDPEPQWGARQDGLLSAVPALLKLATEGPVVICVAHPHAPQQAPGARARQNIRFWVELEHTPDPRALVTCVNIAQGQGFGNIELHRRKAGAAFSSLASAKRWRGALQHVWARKDQAFLRMVAAMGVGYVVGPRVGTTPPMTGYRASRPLLKAREARLRTLRVESAVIDRLVCELVGAVKLAEAATKTQAATVTAEDEIACGLDEVVLAVVLLLLERHNRQAFARSTAGIAPEDQPTHIPDGDGRNVGDHMAGADAAAREGVMEDEAEGIEEIETLVDHDHDEELDYESESDENEVTFQDHRQHLEQQSEYNVKDVASRTAGVGIAALLRACSHPSRSRSKSTQGGRSHPCPPLHYLAATAIWRLAIDAKCRSLVEIQLERQGMEWSLAPSVGTRSIEASAEPILWRAERVVWLGWWNSRCGCASSGGRGGSSTDLSRVEGNRQRCWFALLSQELMRCIIRELRPIGLRTEYIVLPARV